MKHKRYSALILAMALLIIGMRGVCMAQFSSQHASIDKSDTQESNEAQPAIQNNKSTSINFRAERIRSGFTFRVKKYFVKSPSHSAFYQAPFFTGFTGLDRIYMSILINHVNPVKPTLRLKPL